MIGNVLSSLVGDLIHSSNSLRRQVHFKRELNLNPESPTFVKLYKMENKTRKSPCERDKGGGHHVKISSPYQPYLWWFSTPCPRPCLPIMAYYCEC